MFKPRFAVMALIALMWSSALSVADPYGGKGRINALRALTR
jgi:hypothetical protein